MIDNIIKYQDRKQKSRVHSWDDDERRPDRHDTYTREVQGVCYIFSAMCIHKLQETTNLSNSAALLPCGQG